MGDYMNGNQNDFYWQQPNQLPETNKNYYEQDFTQFGNQPLGKFSSVFFLKIIA